MRKIFELSFSLLLEFGIFLAAAYLTKSTHFTRPPNLDEYSEKFDNTRDELLKVFVGKRQSHPIRIETYDFEKLKMSHKNNNNNKSLITNSMTMQAALETAYSEWNKEKSSSTSESISPIPSSSLTDLEHKNEQKSQDHDGI